MSEQTLSTLPISVGTGLAIESLVQTPISKYHNLMFNIRTLFRNMLGSFEKDKLPEETELVKCLINDISGIASAIGSMDYQSHINLVFYQPSYKKLSTYFPHAKLKVIGEKGTTQRQLEIEQLRESVTASVLSQLNKFIINTDIGFPSFTGNALIMTHHPVDLVMAKAYSRLHLLESHTGAIKKFSTFNTKLTGYKKIPNIPLNKLTIQVFGDNATNFYSLPIGVKNEIIQLADAKQWSSASSPSYCIETIRSLPKSAEKEILLKLIK